MIAFLAGQVRRTQEGEIILQVGDIGYQVYSVGFVAEPSQTLELEIYDHVREDRRELYGFVDLEVMHLFLKLIDISGVGTKLAQKILNSISHAEMVKRVAGSDIGFLTSIPGIGKKTAQKLVLELQGVLVLETAEDQVDTDTLEALMSLGYSRQDCLEVLGQIEGDDPESRLRHALKLMARE